MSAITTKHGTTQVAKAALISTVPPLMLKI